MSEEEAAEKAVPVNRQGSEEDMERMAEVVKDTVVKLFEDDENPPVNVDNDKWYYRDPQGVVQGTHTRQRSVKKKKKEKNRTVH